MHVVPATGAASSGAATALLHGPRAPWRQYVEAIAWVAGSSALAFVVREWLSTTDIAMLHLLGVVFAAVRVATAPALTAAVVAIALFDFCFVPPYFTFAIAERSYALTFAVFLAVAVGVVRLLGRLRSQTIAARQREGRTAALYVLGRRLAAARRREEIATALAEEVAATIDADTAVLLHDAVGGMMVGGLGGNGGLLIGDAKEETVARWVLQHGQPAGLGTATLSAAAAQHLPLNGTAAVLGVLAVRPRDPLRLRDPAEGRLLETAARLAGSALDRVGLAQARQAAQVEVEAERLRTSLLSSLSHDLRTPLAGIEGAASSLLDAATVIDADQRRDLAQTILEESRRMTRLVGNLLEMVKVESDSLMVARELQPLEEVVGSVLIRLDLLLEQHHVVMALPDDLPLVAIDGILIEQVLGNLLENAAKYAPAGTRITIAAAARADGVEVSVMDEGPGVPPEEERAIFGKFHRVEHAGAPSGVGLGLAICAGILKAHGGRIWAERREPHGLAVRFLLPGPGMHRAG